MGEHVFREFESISHVIAFECSSEFHQEKVKIINPKKSRTKNAFESGRSTIMIPNQKHFAVEVVIVVFHEFLEKRDLMGSECFHAK